MSLQKQLKTLASKITISPVPKQKTQPLTAPKPRRSGCGGCRRSKPTGK